MSSVNPFCIHLQSKNIIKRTKPMREDADVLDGSNHCWCERTGHVLGPDRYAVEPSECRVEARRECFESPVSELAKD